MRLGEDIRGRGRELFEGAFDPLKGETENERERERGFSKGMWAFVPFL